jgi:hypothetical protein
MYVIIDRKKVERGFNFDENELKKKRTNLAQLTELSI